MIKLYGYDTINTMKILMMLYETELEYELVPIDIRRGAQHTAEFRAINPAGKVPVIWDGETYQAESNSILLTLAQRTGWGLANDPELRADMIAWLFYQASTQGPYFGQIEYWTKLAAIPNPDALAHFHTIAKRTIEHLDRQLCGTPYFCGDMYGIADIALFPWLNAHEKLGLELENSGNLVQWLKRIEKRPATQSALSVFKKIAQTNKG